jgi:hypothetical protein
MDGRATEELKVQLVQAALPCTERTRARGAKPLPSRPPAERRLFCCRGFQRFRERYLNETDRTPAQLPQTVAPHRPSREPLPGARLPPQPLFPGAPYRPSREPLPGARLPPQPLFPGAPYRPSRELLPGARLRAPSWHDSVPSPRRSRQSPSGRRSPLRTKRARMRGLTRPTMAARTRTRGARAGARSQRRMRARTHARARPTNRRPARARVHDPIVADACSGLPDGADRFLEAARPLQGHGRIRAADARRRLVPAHARTLAHARALRHAHAVRTDG